MELVEYAPSDARSGILLVGFPSHGVVGGVAANFLIENLDMERIGGLHDRHLPPTLAVNDGFGGSPVSLHVHKGACSLGAAHSDRLYVLKSDTVVPPNLYHDVAEAIMTWAVPRGVEAIVALEGVHADTVDGADVLAFGGAPGRRLLEHLEVSRADGLTFTGFSAALVLASNRSTIPTASLITRANPEIPDAEAAARLLTIVNPLFPTLDLEPERLARRAERIEARMRETETETRQEMEDLESKAVMGYMYG